MTPDHSLRTYIETEIIPHYDGFDPAHSREHAYSVIERSLRLGEIYGLDPDMLYTAAAYHDTGLCEGRQNHHLVSGRIVREDPVLRKWFSEEQIETIAQAAEDHRASSGHEPRSIYGRIIAEADRLIDPVVTVRRTIQYGLVHYPEKSREEHWTRMLEHLGEKYAEGGYLKLLIPESDNAARLAELRALIRDKERLRAIFDREYDAGRTEPL